MRLAIHKNLYDKIKRTGADFVCLNQSQTFLSSVWMYRAVRNRAALIKSIICKDICDDDSEEEYKDVWCFLLSFAENDSDAIITFYLDDQSLKIDWVYVDKKIQDQGFASLLIAVIISLAINNQIDQVILEDRSSKPGIYQRYGFSYFNLQVDKMMFLDLQRHSSAPTKAILSMSPNLFYLRRILGTQDDIGTTLVPIDFISLFHKLHW